MSRLNRPLQIDSSRSIQRRNPAAKKNQQFDPLGQQEDQYLATSVGDSYSQRNESDPNWLHQISSSQSNQRSHPAPITEQRVGLLGQQEELQNNSQEPSTGDPYSERNDHEPNLPHQISLSQSERHSHAAAATNQPFGLLGQQEELQNNSQPGLATSFGDPYSQRNDSHYESYLLSPESYSWSNGRQYDLCGRQEESQNNSQGGQYLETSSSDPHSQRNDTEPNWPHQISFSQSNKCSQAAPIADQRFGHFGLGQQQKEESQNNSLEGQYLVTFDREPHSQRNDNEANGPQEVSFPQSNQLEQTSFGTTSNRAGSLIPSQTVEVAEQPLGQSRETSTPDCQNIGKFSQEDRQRLKDLQKKKRRDHISQEEERCLQALVKKRKKMHDYNHRQKKKDILEEKDRIIQQKNQHIEAVEAENRELKGQLEEMAKREQKIYNKIISLNSNHVSTNGRVQDVSRRLAEFDNLHNDDEQPNVTLPESMQTESMEVAGIQNDQYDELEERNGTGRTRRKPSTREQDTVDEDSNSQPNFLHRLFKGLKWLKNNFSFS